MKWFITYKVNFVLVWETLFKNFHQLNLCWSGVLVREILYEVVYKVNLVLVREILFESIHKLKF